VTLVPYLQAEEDRRFVAARERALELEADLMKDVPDWKVSNQLCGQQILAVRVAPPPLVCDCSLN
jgi:hypothetical protein